MRSPRSSFFFFNDTATTEIYTLSLHDALPIWIEHRHRSQRHGVRRGDGDGRIDADGRSEEHTSELQSHSDLVCRLLLEKKRRSYSGAPTRGCGSGGVLREERAAADSPQSSAAR